LSTVTIRLATDAQGRPVLNLYSESAFTDPVVELIVDVRWGAGKLVRDYSLLLDPAVFRTAARDAAPVVIAPVIAAPVVAAPVVSAPIVTAAVVTTPNVRSHATSAAPSAAPAVAQDESGATIYRVRPRDTLYAIVRQAGAVTEADRQRMMIALFRGNPAAFDGNINLLHRDALLTMPALASLAVMDAVQARREVAGQMSAWRHSAVARSAQVQAPKPDPVPEPVAEPVVEPPVAPTVDPVAQDVAEAATAAPPTPPESPFVADQPAATETQAIEPAVPVATRHATGPRSTPLKSIVLVLGLPLLGLALLTGLAIVLRQRVRRVPLARYIDDPTQTQPAVRQVVADRTHELPLADESPTVRLPAETAVGASVSESTQEMEAITVDDAAAQIDTEEGSTVETTAGMAVNTETVILEGMASDDTILDVGAVGPGMARVQGTKLDYNLVDLDATSQHVHMPSDLNDRATFVERRTNMIDALRAAISRDPSRNDLRMKLLETYFSNAATNRRAFAEFVRLQASEPASLSADEWRKIELMGQELGLELVLPSKQSEDDDLANCA
ncbi:MAG: hypothetical protein RL684_2586, partial [Pseudomonadota bacterium]